MPKPSQHIPAPSLSLLAPLPSLLLIWYDKEKRDLPWRKDPSPYRVWVSEIMLQQTRVEAVKPYYARFLSALPTLFDLAHAKEETLFKLWEGLGYYRRVQNMQKAAQLVLARYGGSLPGDYAALLSLPGIGPYTAGAIGSIAFSLPVPAVDGNVVRVFSRLLNLDWDVSLPAVRKEVGRIAAALLPPSRPGAFNQALMELGATRCLPHGIPLCESCPVSPHCQGYQLGTASLLPVKGERKPRRIQEITVLLLLHQQKVALCRRNSSGLLAGLFQFFPLDGHHSAKGVQDWFARQNIVVPPPQPLGAAKHLFTHVEWRMTGYAISLSSLLSGLGDYPLLWVDENSLTSQYAIPSAFSFYQNQVKKLLSP